MADSIEAWRLAGPEHSRTVEDMLSGDGAYRHGGRWNSPGRRAVYLGGSLALASMELLVHLRTPEVLQAYRKLRVRIPVGLIQDVDVRDLPPGWAVPSLQPPTQEIGDRWLDSLQSAVLRVPSAVVTGEVNYVLNPAHECACRIEAGRIECPVPEVRELPRVPRHRAGKARREVNSRAIRPRSNAERSLEEKM